MDEDTLLDLYDDTSHRGPLCGATHSAYARNPVCGDEVTLQLAVSNGRVDRARFTGSGCVISQAAAAGLCSVLERESVRTLTALTEQEWLAEFPVRLSAFRQQCALVPLRALHSILERMDN